MMKKTVQFVPIIAIAMAGTMFSCVDSGKDLYDPSYETPNPVSYTHLDVYKRQLHKCVEELTNKYLEVIESEDFKKEFDQLLRDYVGPVSYTHLNPNRF